MKKAKNGKRLLSFALALTLMLALVPMIAPVSAADEITVKEIVSGLEYDRIGEFRDGLAFVLKDNKYGFIDKTGKEIVPCTYDNPHEYNYGFSEGLAFVRKGDEWSYIDTTGKVVLSLGDTYDYVYSFKEGMARVQKDFDEGYIDTTGKEIVPCIHDGVKDFSEGLGIAWNSGKYTFIDKTGKEVLSVESSAVSPFSEGLAVVNSGSITIGKYGYIDKTGKEIIPFVYDDASSFSEGLAGVQKDGKWGFIDKTGKEVIACTYNWVSPFSEGLANVSKDGKYGYIDKVGNEVIPIEITDQRLQHGHAFSFHNGLAFVAKMISDTKSSWSLIDKTGKTIELPEYIITNANDFNEGLAAAKKDDNKWVILEISGYKAEQATTEDKAEPVIAVDDKPSDKSKSNPNNVKQGNILGSVLNSDITAHINGYAIPSWNVKGKTVVSADDLTNYGFNVEWNGTARTVSITFDKSKKMTPIDFPKSTKKSGSFQWNYLATNIRTYVAGNEVTAYNVAGKTLIDIEDLAAYGSVTWNAETREIILITTK